MFGIDTALDIMGVYTLPLSYAITKHIKLNISELKENKDLTPIPTVIKKELYEDVLLKYRCFLNSYRNVVIDSELYNSFLGTLSEALCMKSIKYNVRNINSTTWSGHIKHYISNDTYIYAEARAYFLADRYSPSSASENERRVIDNVFTDLGNRTIDRHLLEGAKRSLEKVIERNPSFVEAIIKEGVQRYKVVDSKFNTYDLVASMLPIEESYCHLRYDREEESKEYEELQRNEGAATRFDKYDLAAIMGPIRELKILEYKDRLK